MFFDPSLILDTLSNFMYDKHAEDSWEYPGDCNSLIREVIDIERLENDTNRYHVERLRDAEHILLILKTTPDTLYEFVEVLINVNNNILPSSPLLLPKKTREWEIANQFFDKELLLKAFEKYLALLQDYFKNLKDACLAFYHSRSNDYCEIRPNIFLHGKILKQYRRGNLKYNLGCSKDILDNYMGILDFFVALIQLQDEDNKFEAASSLKTVRRYSYEFCCKFFKMNNSSFENVIEVIGRLLMSLHSIKNKEPRGSLMLVDLCVNQGRLANKESKSSKK